MTPTGGLTLLGVSCGASSCFLTTGLGADFLTVGFLAAGFAGAIPSSGGIESVLGFSLSACLRAC